MAPLHQKDINLLNVNVILLKLPNKMIIYIIQITLNMLLSALMTILTALPLKNSFIQKISDYF